MIKNTSTEIQALESQIKEMQEKLRSLKKVKTANLVDYKRLEQIDKCRHVLLASHISYIARAAVSGDYTETLYSWPNIPLSRHKLAQQVASQIIDIYEQAYNQHIWEKDVNNHE